MAARGEVWRLEFEFKRDFLKDRQLSSLAAVLDNLNGLWSYATTEWLRLTVANLADATRSRWPTHSLWIALASLDWERAHSLLLDKCSNTRNPTELRLVDTFPKIKLLPGEVERDCWLTRAEAETLIRCCAPHLAALVRFPLATGCRAAEITGLEWSRVDLNRKTAWINRTKNGMPR